MNQLDKTNNNFKFPDEINQYEERIFKLLALLELSKELNSTLQDYNFLIEAILTFCLTQMRCLNAGIFIKRDYINDENDVFVLHRKYEGFELDHSLEYAIPDSSKIIKFLDENYKCYTLAELVSLFHDEPSIDTFKIVAPDLIVPINAKGELKGIIILGEKISIPGEIIPEGKFSISQKKYLLHISSLAGIAIQNAHLYERAITDMMTKLKLHHFFQNRLKEEIEHAKEMKTSLSLMMMDIDHFKNFNDTHGHTGGDAILKNVGRLINENIRQIDIASRYGGEEFSVILPETDIGMSVIVAERIRRSIELSKVSINNKYLGVTISIGVCQYNPERDKDGKDLIDLADKALYISKKKGRNRVSVLG